MHAKLVIAVETEKEKVLRKEFVFDDTKVSVFLKAMLPILTSVTCTSLNVMCFVVLWIQKREGFCQLLQQMKNKHSEKPEPDMITVFVGTWNMGNSDVIQNSVLQLT